MSSPNRTPLLQESRGGENGHSQPDAESGRLPPVSFWRVLALAKEERLVLVFATIALAFSSLATVALPGFAGQLVDSITDLKDTEEGRVEARKRVLEKLVDMLGIVLLGSVSSFVRSFLFTSASERVVYRLRSNLFKNLTRQEVGFFDVTKTGELLNRLSEDTQVIKNAATVNLSEFLRSVATGSMALFFMFLTSWKLTALTLAVVPPSAFGIRRFGMYLRKLSEKTQAASAEAAAVAEQSLSSIRTVRAFAQEGTESEKYSSKVQVTMELGIQQALAFGLFSGGISGVAFLCVVSVLTYGAFLTIDGQMTVGALSSFVLYSTMVGFSFGTLSGLFASIAKAMGASKRVFNLLDRKPTLDHFQGKQKPDLDNPKSAGIVLEDVWFAYPSRPADIILEGINLELPFGSRVALVGPSGGGKSTIASLVQRLYDPSKGRILLSGVPLTDIDHDYLHSVVSVVSQEPTLFNDTIAHNIAYSVKGKIDQSEVERVAKLANAHDFISKFPEGYDTVVGERGVRLSGGQKQRVAIARALLTDPRILLLDEATSALDAENEYFVQDAMDKLMEGRTTLVIAHRLSTVQGADMVAVIHNGIIAERGSHDELFEKGGIYAGLVKRQLQAARVKN